MKKLFLLAAVCCMSLLTFAEAGAICDMLLGDENATTGASVPARVRWTTDDLGNVDITIMPFSKAEETAAKPTAWRGRGMADNLTADQGWLMIIDGTDAVLADYFDKEYTSNGNQALAPAVYRLKIKDGKKAELDGKTVVIQKTTAGSNICWWTPRSNNGYAKYAFDYLYGSICEDVTVPAPAGVEVSGNTLTFQAVDGADSYTANIYLDGNLVKSIANFASGTDLYRLMRTGAAFQVKVVAKAGAVESEESEPADWVVADEVTEVGVSEYCGETIGAQEAEYAAMTWQTDENGNINIYIAGNEAAWRGTAFKGMDYFWIGECPASLFFVEQYKQGSNVYTLLLKDAAKAPVTGETIRFQGTSQWKTATAGNAYAENVTYTYTYTAACAALETPTNVNVDAAGKITFSEVEGADSYVATISRNQLPVAIYRGIASDTVLPYQAIESDTYSVTVYAQGFGATDSEESEPFAWTLTGTGWETAPSDVCGTEYMSDTYDGNPYPIAESKVKLNITTSADSIIVSILPVIDNDEVSFRKDDAMGLASFSTNGVPASVYFTTESKDAETTYVLTLKEDRSLPYGTVIDYKGTLQWRTKGDPNSYKYNVAFSYVFGSLCSQPTGPTDTVQAENQPVVRKAVFNGHLYIIRENHMYDAFGRQVR